MIALDLHLGHAPRNARRRQEQGWIKDEIVALQAYPAHLVGVDELSDFESKQVHETFDWHLGHTDFLRVNPNMALWRCDRGAFRFEWNITFGRQLPVHFNTVACRGDGDILNRSVGSSKHV